VLANVGLKIINPERWLRSLWSLEAGWLAVMKGRVDIIFCCGEDVDVDVDVDMRGKLSIRPEGTDECSEENFQPGSIVIVLEGMCYCTEPGGIPFGDISFEISAL
jgi:hypothetical protein